MELSIEEKKAMVRAREHIIDPASNYLSDEEIETLLNLIEKQQKEIKELKEKQTAFKEMKEELKPLIKGEYISKDKVLKVIGYEEDDEEYDRLKQDNEKLLAILDTLYSEVCRLEDIEDKKVEVAVSFIEEKRDKYWRDKIRKRLEKLKEKEQELSDEQGYFGSSELQAKIEELEELLEE